ncbi:MAG: UDP-N-acetylglucosamine/UDP-N-acetylgalactosamine diphosphorylase [Planctomycetota bacterium]|jgi:UDP-N-acetylglucosamine/UDP-N-acetylgalactosamine diphosphorylase
MTGSSTESQSNFTPAMIDALRKAAEAYGQGHVFAFWDDLDEPRRNVLAGQVSQVDFDLTRELGELLSKPTTEQAVPSFEPPELFPLVRDERKDQEARAAIKQGEALMSEGLVAAILVAGGQGSRLGFDGPKGIYPVGPVSNCSLFEWHARRLMAAQQRYGAAMPWYIMTSASNDAATRTFFEDNNYFGLRAADVQFFQQAMLPALDLEGKILMASKGELFLAPNGHGGTLAALKSSGCLADAAKRGIEAFSYFQVDNPLAMPADPLFLGLHVTEGASMSSKIVKKRDAGEKVGVIGMADGVLGCIEYSDLPAELREATDEQGELLFGAGNTAAHAFERRFLEELTGEGGISLPWHVARKRMKVLDETGQIVERDGAKFETFIFDALGSAERSITLETDRALEFSPVKNAEGSDSPATTRRDLTVLFAGWLTEAGLTPPSLGEDGAHPLEVDPRFAEDAASFAERMPADPNRRDEGEIFG